MKTTTMGTVKVYWLIKSIRLNNSIILCKHWRCDLSVDHFSERENHTFLTKKKLEKVTATYLQFQEVEKLAVHEMPSVVHRSEAENLRGFLSKIIAFECKYLLSDCVAKIDMKMENGRIQLVQAEKDLNHSVKI